MKKITAVLLITSSIYAYSSEFAGLMPSNSECKLTQTSNNTFITVHGKGDDQISTVHKNLLQASRTLMNLKELGICNNKPTLGKMYSGTTYENACDLYLNGNGNYVVRNGLDWGRVASVFDRNEDAIETANNLAKAGFCLLKKP